MHSAHPERAAGVGSDTHSDSAPRQRWRQELDASDSVQFPVAAGRAEPPAAVPLPAFLRGSPPADPLPLPVIDLEAEGDSDLAEEVGVRITRGVPPWLSSFLFHTALLLLLALWNLGASHGHRIISLSAGAAADESLDDFSFSLPPLLNDPLLPAELLALDDVDVTSEALQAESLDDAWLAAPVDFSSVWGTEASALLQLVGASDLNGDRGGGAQGAGPYFFGIPAEGRRLVFVIDKSGSMRGARWRAAVDELIGAMDQLDDSYEFFILLFDDRAYPMLGLRGRQRQLHSGTEENLERAITWLRRQSPGSNTSPLESMQIALGMGPDVIYLLSDGIFNDGTLEMLRVANRKRSTYGYTVRTVVHAIAFDSLEGAPMLQQIARENSGVFRFIPLEFNVVP